jgi:molybdenum cofactor cytidylyltransferase
MPRNPSSLSAILLAAGQSRRMGAFKPLLPFGNTTVIESCLNYLSEGGAESIVVVVGHRAADLREHLSGYPVTFALNPDPTSQMTTSIAAGVRNIPDSTGAVLIALVDYPAIPPVVVASLLNQWSKGHRLVKPTWQGRGGHPVLVDLCFRTELLALEPSIGLKGLFELHKEEVRRIEVDTPYVARDLDTWDDYQRLHSEIFGESAPGPAGPDSNEKLRGHI